MTLLLFQRPAIRAVQFLLTAAVCVSHGQTLLPPVDLSRIKPDRLSHSFEKVRYLSADTYTPVDFDGDGEDEFIIQADGDSSGDKAGYIIVEDIEKNRTRDEAMFSGRITVSPLQCDINGDGFKEFFVGESSGDTASLHGFNYLGKKIFSIPCAVNPKRTRRPWSCGLTAEAAMDVSGDGFPELLIFMNTGMAYQPRGVLCLDVRRSRILWRKNTGFNPQTILLFDVDGDKKREILLGSASPDNGEAAFGPDHAVSGTDDKHVYTAVLDSSGKPPHFAEIGGRFAELLLFSHDLDYDGHGEILALFSRDAYSEQTNFFGFWNPSAGNMTPQPLLRIEKEPVKSVEFLDADRNGVDDVLIAWKDGTVEIRDRSFDVLRSRPFPGFDIRRFTAADLDNDGETEIIANGVFRNLFSSLVMNRFLDLLAWEHQNTGFEGVVHTGFGKEKLLLERTYSGSKGVNLVRMKKQSRALPDIPWGWILAGFAIGTTATAIRLRRMARKSAEKARAWALQAMLDSDRVPAFLLDENGKILAANREAERFFSVAGNHVLNQPYGRLFLAGNWNPVRERIGSFIQTGEIQAQQELALASGGEHRDILLFIASVLLDPSGRKGTMVRIQDVSELTQSKRAVAWASMAQKLAHEIKTPLSTVMLSAQHLQMESERSSGGWKEGPKYVERIVRQVERLQKMTDAFLKFSRIEKPRFEACDINAAITDYLQENQYRTGSDVKIVKTLAQDLPAIRADRQQIVLVLQNVIDNGLTAMGGKGVLSITTRLVQSLQEKSPGKNAAAVQIEISDTGKGISKDDLTRLFQPFFSRSPGGTGLGLVIVKKIVEDHRGEIRVESEPGNGTSFFITLSERP